MIPSLNISQSAHKLEAACLKLILRNESGGLWPKERGLAPDALTTAEVLSALDADVFPQISHKRFCLKRLAGLQMENGSWSGGDDPDPWDTATTAWSLWALRDNPELGHSAEKAIEFLKQMYRDDGGVGTNLSARASNSYASSYALRSLYRYQEFASSSRLADFIQQFQNPDGGWGLFPGDASEPTLTMYVLDALSDVQIIESAVIVRAIEFVQSHRTIDGTFSSWFETGESAEGTAFGIYVMHKIGCDAYLTKRAAEIMSSNFGLFSGFLGRKPKIWVAVSIYLAMKSLISSGNHATEGWK